MTGAGRFRFRRRMAVVATLVAGLAIALVVVSRHDGGAAKRPTLAQLAATNYRTLTRHESRILLHFAKNEHACLSARGLSLSVPVASRTRITMSAPGYKAFDLARAMMGCDQQVGPPPAKSSLQARPNEILVYLPKRCLMNPHELPQA
jgi:hypothetical protein